MNDDFGLDEVNAERPKDTTVYAAINYENVEKAKAAEAKQAALNQHNRAVFQTLLDHYSLNDTQANQRVIQDFCGGEVSVEKFQVMLSTPGERESLDWSGTHERLIGEIADLLYGHLDSLAPTSAAYNDVAKMKYWTKAALRARLAEIKFRRGKTGADARDLLMGHRAAEEAQNPWRPFKVMPAHLDSVAIKAASPEQIRHWRQLYGVRQVDLRLNQK